MTRLLSLTALLAAGLAVPAFAEETPAPSAPDKAEAKAVPAQQPMRMTRTIGAKGSKSCSRMMPGRRIVWRPLPPQTQKH